ncbi:tripartite tricarboxylate transporter permease, partial [Chloroflexota bacterium]
SLAAKGGSIAKTNKVSLSTRGVVEGAKDVFRHWGLWLRCSIIGYLIGVIPGVGSATATFVAYGQAKQTSKHPEKFGTGTVEGVIAPESCNNAKEGGALLTTMALGIPGSAEMVLVLGAIMMVGITPGPQMLISKLPLAFSLLQVLFVGSLLGAVFCFLMAPRLARIATVPGRILFPIVGVVVFIGAFSRDERFLDLAVLLIFTVIGLAMMKYGFNRPAMLLGYILGDLFEKYLFQALGTAGPLFFMRPISLSIIFIILALFLWNPVSNWLANRSKGVNKNKRENLYVYFVILVIALVFFFFGLNLKYTTAQIYPVTVSSLLILLAAIAIIIELRARSKKEINTKDGGKEEKGKMMKVG